MSRREFSSKTMDQAYARSSGRCENKACGAVLRPGKFHYDHILPDALGGKPTLANCQVLCVGCHKAKTAKEDVPRIRKADRQRKAHIGAKPPPKHEIRNAPAPVRPPQRKASKPPGEGSKLEQVRALGGGEIARRYGAR